MAEKVTTSFFYGGSSAPEQNTVDQLIDTLNQKVQLADESKTAAANSASQAAISASQASDAAASTSSLAGQAAETLTAANAAVDAANQAVADANTIAASIVDDAAAAAQNATDSAASATLAQDWATKTSGPVAGGEYSSKYNAQLSAVSALAASGSASDANTAKVAAQSAQTAAETAKTAAQSAQTAAENAKTGAQTAQGLAESARDSAQTYAGNASTSAGTATNQAGIATTQAGIATTKAGEASSSATSAATAKTGAETARTGAESAQAAAEAARDASLNFGNVLTVAANTLSPGSSATSTYDSSLKKITFGIPTGDTGPTGPQGPAGQGVPVGGSTGQYLKKNSGTDYDTSWSNVDALPSQTGNSGKLLTTDGTTASWSTDLVFASGNLGIGTSSPQGNLALKAASGNTNFAIESAASSRYFISVNNTSNYLAIGGNGATAPSSGALNIDSSGNVFVGGTTALAGSREAVYGATSNQGSGTYPATLELIDTRAYNSTLPQPGGGVAFGYQYTSGGSYALGPSIQGFKENSTDGNYAAGLKFSTRPNGSNPAEAMRIDSSGNVGIGTSSPAVRFVAQADLSSNTEIARFEHSTADAGRGAKISLGLKGYPMGQVEGYADSSGNGSLRFYTYTSTTTTEKMRIDSSGNLLVGTTSAFNAGILSVSVNPALKWGYTTRPTTNSAYNAAVFQDSSGNTAGTIVASGTSTAYNTSSDYRLKENIQPMQNALDVVAQLKPVTYQWKADKSQGQGFIAHELQQVVPDCVTGEKDAVDAEGKPVYQGVDTSFLVATLTAAIKELKAELDATKAEVAALKGTI